ncbi:hypothetical protein IEQ34_005818 [Dendrobium chrysotoxum]|uniref:Uncharacterized protein n=1 Tax=Dendrobium chrysotoxum TaxID=161865 RepID=A0AAV7HC79_DENCH|nr:hypothetical protein IEQ34_005818 [Dendrobium chrysotoxum]
MARKLLFSVDRDLYVEELIHSSIIQFKMGFKSLRLSVNGGTIINLAVEGDKNGPEVKLAVGATDNLPPMLELVAGVTLTPLAPSVQEEDEKFEIKSTVEKGSSSSKPLFGTRSARKNYLRRVRKKIIKSRKIAEQKALSLVEPEAAEELPIPASSPLLKGSHFHPLVATTGEERVARIVSSLPSLIDYSVKRTPKEKHTLRTRMLRNIIHTCAAETGQGPMPSNEPYILIKLSRSVGIQIRDTPIPLPVEVPQLPIQGCEDSILIDVGVPAVQAPPSPVKMDIPRPIEDVTLVTIDPRTVKGEGTVLDVDQEMLEQLVQSPL